MQSRPKVIGRRRFCLCGGEQVRTLLAMPSRCRTLWVTGTDTGCGKTVVTAALALALRKRGVDVGVMKPVASGLVEVEGGLASPDVRFYRAFLGLADPDELVNPIAYAPATAPSVAARLEHRPVDLMLIRRAFTELCSRHEWLLVEGIGGVLVPLSDALTAADLAAAMKLPAVLVARAGLGTLNHTFLSVSALRAREIPLLGIVLTPTSRHPDLAELHNPEEIRIHTGISPIQLPGVPGVSVDLGEGDGLPQLVDGLASLVDVLMGGAAA